MTRFQWETYVPIFKNRFIITGLLTAIGIPFGALAAVLVFLAKGDILGTDVKYALLLLLLLLLFSFFLVMIVYGGKYAPGFIVDDAGIVNYTQEKQAKRGKIINALTVALGLLSGNPTAAGAGMIAQSRQVVRVKWKNIRRVRYYPKNRTILVNGGFGEKIALFCTAENYAEVERTVREHTGKILLGGGLEKQ